VKLFFRYNANIIAPSSKTQSPKLYSCRRHLTHQTASTLRVYLITSCVFSKSPFDYRSSRRWPVSFTRDEIFSLFLVPTRFHAHRYLTCKRRPPVNDRLAVKYVAMTAARMLQEFAHTLCLRRRLLFEE
jgi:hypothetical protein